MTIGHEHEDDHGCAACAAVDPTIEHGFVAKEGERWTCKLCERHVSVHPDKLLVMKQQEWDDIMTVGHQVRAIFGTAETPGFAYSVGRCVFGKSEILITGSLPPRTQMWLVNNAAELMDAGDLKVGEECDKLMEGYSVRVVQVRDLEEAEMFGATNLDPNATAVQIIWPDAAGRFPGDTGYEYGDDAQPIYG